MENFFIDGGNQFKNIFIRLKKRDFSGNYGQAIKNSSYQLMINIVMKLGSFLFTVIIARLLMPELFGLYSLSLTTILFFSAFTDFGMGTALLTFVSYSLGRKKPGKAKAYFKKLLKWKYRLLFLTSIVLFFSSGYIANHYYKKPIFYALLAGTFYIPVVSLISFLENLYKSNNNFKIPFIKEIIFQFLRISIVPFGILILLKLNLSKQSLIGIILILLIFCYLFSLIFLSSIIKSKLPFIKSPENKLTKEEINSLKKFIIPLIVITISGVFFSYADTLILGRFVLGEYLAYYRGALTLIGSASLMTGFFSSALFPIFSRVKKDQLKSLFKKSRNFVIFISSGGVIFVYLFSWWIIRIVYGIEYLPMTPVLKYLSILIVISPLIGLYSSYFTSQKKTKSLAFAIITSTILNIIFNYVFISQGIKMGMMQAVYGAVFAILLSKSIYLGMLIFFKREIKIPFRLRE